MSILKISEGADPNYLATVVRLPEIKPHPGADRLSTVEIFGNIIIIAKDMYTEGEKVVYFPVESAINKEFLSWANLLDKPELNADEKTKGFFESKGRVRAIALRGMPSQGFLYKVSKLAQFYEIKEDSFDIGDTFDTVGDHILVTKYIKGDSKKSGEPNVKKSRVPRWIDKTIGIFPKPMRRMAYICVNAWFNTEQDRIASQIVTGQFKFHYKTEHLGKNLFLLDPMDEITVSSKIHGTSAIFSNLLCKKKFSLYRVIANKFGRNISETEYRFLHASRSIIKNKTKDGYGDDVWGVWAEKLDGGIPEGYSVYGEIAGYTPNGKMIQKNYDYGAFLRDSELYVYRITYTNKDGEVLDLEWDEIRRFCNTHDLKTVPVYYHGEAQKMFDIPTEEGWHEKFLEKLREMYLDKPCEFCTTGVIREGVVLKNNSRGARPVFKFKSPLFVIGESSARDKGEEDIEELN